LRVNFSDYTTLYLLHHFEVDRHLLLDETDEKMMNKENMNKSGIPCTEKGCHNLSRLAKEDFSKTSHNEELPQCNEYFHLLKLPWNFG
jgi:hypothetical protein